MKPRRTKNQIILCNIIYYATILSILAVLLSLMTGCASPQYSMGVGYKVSELEIYKNGETINDPLTARLKVSWNHGDFTYGAEHRSAIRRGAPFNNEREYGSNELFIDYNF